MNELDLLGRHCVEYPAGTPPLGDADIERYRMHVPRWEVAGGKVRRRRRFRNFVAAIDFVNKVAELAAAEGHHPDIRVYTYRWVEIELYTHSIGGLSPNDFILAAKIDRLLESNV